LRGRNAVEDAANNNRAGLQAAFFAGIKAPCNLKLVHIAAIDLHQAGVVVVFRCAAVDRPVAIVLGEAGSGKEQCKCEERDCFQFFTRADAPKISLLSQILPTSIYRSGRDSSCILVVCPQNDASAKCAGQMGGSAIVEQGHKSKIHVKLLVAVEQSEAGIVGDKIDFRFLVAAEHDKVF